MKTPMDELFEFELRETIIKRENKMVETSQKKENTAKEHLDPLPGQVLKAQENLH